MLEPEPKSGATLVTAHYSERLGLWLGLGHFSIADVYYSRPESYK